MKTLLEQILSEEPSSDVRPAFAAAPIKKSRRADTWRTEQAEHGPDRQLRYVYKIHYKAPTQPTRTASWRRSRPNDADLPAPPADAAAARSFQIKSADLKSSNASALSFQQEAAGSRVGKTTSNEGNSASNRASPR